MFEMLALNIDLGSSKAAANNARDGRGRKLAICVNRSAGRSERQTPPKEASSASLLRLLLLLLSFADAMVKRNKFCEEVCSARSYSDQSSGKLDLEISGRG